MKTRPIFASLASILSEMIPGVKEAIEARKERRRVKGEQEAAKRRSDLIDESIKAQRIKQRRERDDVIPVLLVGLPGSGKSTTLKHFQMMYDKTGWEAGRAFWSAVILLQAVQSMIQCFEILATELRPQPSSSGNVDVPIDDIPFSGEGQVVVLTTELERNRTSVSVVVDTGDQPPSSIIQDGKDPIYQMDGRDVSRSGTPSTDQAEDFAIHLALLHGIEAEIRDALRIVNEYHLEIPSNALQTTTFSAVSSSQRRLDSCRAEFRTFIDRWTAVWTNKSYQDILSRHERGSDRLPSLREEELQRISHHKYRPSDVDILSTDFKNAGLTQQDSIPKYSISTDHEYKTYIFYDMGHTLDVMRIKVWIPMVDIVVDHLIFHFSLSCTEPFQGHDYSHFSESLVLWNSLCKSPFLRNTYFSICFTKLDELDTFFASGGSFKDCFPPYKGENTVLSVVAFWKDKLLKTARMSRYRLGEHIQVLTLGANDIGTNTSSLEELKSFTHRVNLRPLHIGCNLS